MSVLPENWEFEHAIEGQDQGCGQLLLTLRLEFANFTAGALVVVASRDAGAPVELPAWCRLTGHRLVEARPPFYLIQKRNHSEGE